MPSLCVRRAETPRWGVFYGAVGRGLANPLGLYCTTKSSTLWGAALFVLHGFYGAVKERIRTARALALRPAGRNARVGVSRARLGESALTYCTKSSTLWGAALFVLHGFYGAVKERIRTARAPRFASRGAETPRWGVSRARLGESALLLHQEQHLMGCCSFCFAWILWSSKRADSNSPCPSLCVPRGRNAPVGRF